MRIVALVAILGLNTALDIRERFRVLRLLDRVRHLAVIVASPMLTCSSRPDR